MHVLADGFHLSAFSKKDGRNACPWLYGQAEALVTPPSGGVGRGFGWIVLYHTLPVPKAPWPEKATLGDFQGKLA